jgi:hypothetical protein
MARIVAIAVMVVGLAFARSSPAPPAPPKIDFRRADALEWTLQLDALRDVRCSRIGRDEFSCRGVDEQRRLHHLRVRVSPSGGSWQTEDEAAS